MAKKRTEKSEVKRLMEIFSRLPANKLKVAEGLIIQAARMRIQLDKLSEDIAENGTTELFQQSEKVEPYNRERPQASLFLKMDKNYQGVMKLLIEMCPEQECADELAEFLKGR